jgi:hypothetical protein
MASGKVWDPQSWNRYTYTLNNPLDLDRVHRGVNISGCVLAISTPLSLASPAR